MLKKNTHKVHFLMRSGFGWSLTNIDSLLKKHDLNSLIKWSFEQSKNIDDMEWISQEEYINARANIKEMSPQERKEKRKQSRKITLAMNASWINRMATENSFIREKMTFFWHTHFACESKNAYLVQLQNNTLRKHALGNFKDLVIAISKDPAMIDYLNNKQNKKKAPNENYARELMELFTLGIGNYTEEDIKNAARAFTGWSYDKNAEFILRKRQHDNGTKTFMGKEGNFNGEDIIDIILAKEECAHWIASKLYKFFVNDIVNPAHLKELAQVLYDNKYEIKPCLEHLFKADWFYAKENVGTKIKSPIELIAGMMRQLSFSFGREEGLLIIQKILGQTLFFPPNVSGWKTGQSWIDSSRLLFRLKMPSVLFYAAAIPFNLADSGDDNEILKVKKLHKKLEVSMSWTPLVNTYLDEKKFKKVVEVLCKHLFTQEELANSLTIDKDMEVNESNIQKVLVQLISLPEYQLC